MVIKKDSWNKWTIVAVIFLLFLAGYFMIVKDNLNISAFVLFGVFLLSFFKNEIYSALRGI